MAEIVTEQPSCLVPYRLGQGVISAGGMDTVHFLDQCCQIISVSFIVIDISVQPFAVSRSVYGHHLTQILDWIVLTQCFDDLVFAPEIETYSLSAPPPFTMYPFFNLSFSILSFRFSSSGLSSLDSDFDA